jgi:predicted peptidase
MRKLLLLSVVAVVLAGCCTTRGQALHLGKPVQPLPGKLPAYRFTHTVTENRTCNFLVHLPPGYLAATKQKYPLILFLHGAGERGDDAAKVTVHGPPKLLTPGANLSTAERAAVPYLEQFIVISPQCPANERWDNDTLLALLDQFIQTQRVDTNRVYLTGLSMGGYGTWSLGVRHPERFAALAPVCGGGERIDVLLGSRTKGAALKSLGIWAFHGGKDTVVPPDESERMVNALKKAGVTDIQLTIYPEAAHDSWSATYANPKLYEWFLQHRRN